MGLPKTGGTEWAGPQATPWTGVNDAHRRLDALASRAIVVDRDLTAPPVSCADGANYLVAAAATGLWDTRDGQLATAVGDDAVNGWLFQSVNVQGYRLSVQDEAVELEYDGAAWVDVTTGGGAGAWGAITGTLADQTDLQAALDAKASLTGATFTGDIIVPDDAYDATGWNGNNEAPTKNAVRDKIESLSLGGVPAGAITSSGLTMATSRLLGRTTASTGAIEEIAIGSGLTLSGGSLSATGGSGNLWALQWSPLANEPPASNYATLDTRNGRPCLDFDTTTQETAIFTGVLPADYSGAGVTVHLWVALTSATSGTVGWDVAFERTDVSSLDIDADSFGSATTVTAVTVPGTSGQVLKMSVNVSNGSNMDSLAAGELFRLRIRRDVANDTATGDAELLRVMMVSQ